MQSRGRGNIRDSGYTSDQPLQPPGGRGGFQSLQRGRGGFSRGRTVVDLSNLGGQISFLQFLKTANVFSHNYTTNSGEYVNINILTVYTRGKAG